MNWRLRRPRLPRASWRVLAWAGAALVVMVLWMTAPLGLRRLRFFRVRQVEIVGIRYLDADQVLAALRLSPAASVFDETQVPWPYGGFCLEAMDAHGGWLASAVDLARFAAALEIWR